MPRIHFSGIVRLATGVQRALSGPVPPARREQLRKQVLQAVELVDRTLRVHGASLTAIPGPTRRAYQFLRAIDFDQVQTASDAESAVPPAQLALSGITARVEEIADDLAQRVKQSSEACAHCQHRVRYLLERIDASNGRSELRSEHFTSRTREHLAWLRFLADDDNFGDYLAALRRASAIFDSIACPDRWPRPIVVHFRPTQSLFRVRAAPGQTRALLPTPIIVLDDAGFLELARAMFGRRNRRLNATLHAILLSEPYQELQAELEALGGVVEETRGMVHDLLDSFDRVNATYFAGQVPRPRLTWNRTITAGKFGHYNYSTDTVMISRALDRPGVPAFVLDHVMHHELLHKKHGLRWHQGRGHAHTGEFREEERQFVQYHEADEVLRRLATRAV